MRTIWNKNKKRSGLTLVETVIAMGIFGIILAIVISMFMTSLNHTKTEREAFQFQQGIDDFVYNLSKEMKSAVEVEVSGDSRNCVLEIIGDDFLIFYEVNNIKGEIIRSEDNDYLAIVNDFASCTFHQEDKTSFTLLLYVTEDDLISSVFRCGVPAQIEEPEEDSFISEPET